MSIAPVEISEDSCSEQFHNISLNHNLFDFAATIWNLSIFYGCPLEDDIPSQNRFSCFTSNGNSLAYYLDESLLRIHRSALTDCNISITVPVNQSEFDELLSGNDIVADAWNKGFDVMYHKDINPCMECRKSGGVGGSGNTSLEFLCFCRDHPYSEFCLASGMNACSPNIFSRTPRVLSQMIISTPSISIFTFFFISLILLPISYCQDDKSFEDCFSPFNCGDIGNLTFPFWIDDRPELCRQEGFRLTKCGYQQPVIDIGGNEFRLVYLNQATYTMTIARNDLWEHICLENPINITLDYPFLSYPQTNRNLTFFYNCNPPQFNCTLGLRSFYADDLTERDKYEGFNSSCGTAIQVQVNQSAFSQLWNERPQLLEDWRLGFDVVYNFSRLFCSKCNSLNGRCGNWSSPLYPICSKPGTHNPLNPTLHQFTSI
ncbi:LEAF RUST 10 DISEASE-RESISTANCE LOCUS RECEPTOR-LIKE PROTEIN KINASE-like 2.7 [Durio zibethinus]|uniref:LEAF RUST 10 DISEASE-RESISTANCE LOCUS RECEPTOR-LIKE PROTEIN KINASE-like 2.7 n=1 Tax=Durio zibethinus TaxID=66656 RepID=A0A6P5Y9W1_DURZI|nr:LEAF RUST 10 DISEASE-RESISTANCE LOCUS RECEPTOR-LIKE PROTEIN KINASE-like 2.7 [Durio zibethinus]